jgi:hypothetical protein
MLPYTYTVPVWCSGQSSWLHIQRSRFDSRCYQIFWVAVGLERGPLSLVSTIEELLGRNSSGFGLENQEYSHGDLLRWPRDTLHPQKLALTSPTSGCRSVGIVRLRTKAMEFTHIHFANTCIYRQIHNMPPFFRPVYALICRKSRIMRYEIGWICMPLGHQLENLIHTVAHLPLPWLTFHYW